MTETQRAAMHAAHNALKTAQNAITFDDDGLWGQYKVALDSITAALAEPEPADEPFAYLPVNLPDVFTHNAGCTLWAGNPQNKTLSADNSMIAVYTRPQRREPLKDEQIDYIYNEHRGDGGPTAICEQFAPALLAAHGIGANKP